MYDSMISIPNMKGVETYYSAIALSALLGVSAPTAAIPPVQKDDVYQVQASSPTKYFETIDFVTRVTGSDLLPDLPKIHKAKARIKYVRKMEFSKDLFD